MRDTVISTAELHPPIEVPVPRGLALGLAAAAWAWSAFAVALGVRLLAALAPHLPLGHAVTR